MFVTYDTGNITSCKIDHEDYIYALKDKIGQVHLKDRNFGSTNTVIPGTGDTDFPKIFKILKDIDYAGYYTLQTAREKSGNEIDTIKKHRQIMEKYYYG